MGKILSIYVVAIVLGSITGLICSFLMLAIKIIEQCLILGEHFAYVHGWSIAWCSGLMAALMVYASWWLTVRLAPEAEWVVYFQHLFVHRLQGLFW